MIAQAVRHLPTAVRVWIKAADLEPETKAKRRVFRKGIILTANQSTSSDIKNKHVLVKVQLYHYSVILDFLFQYFVMAK